MIRSFLIAALLVGIVACGKDHGSTIDASGDPTGDGNNGDGQPGDSSAPFDAMIPANCAGGPVAGAPQCSDCMDNDQDGQIDGNDIECTGAADNDEGSFSTGIPGDNKDAVKQDCFFDGNSGGPPTDCNIHVCCLLGAVDKAHCPIGANQYDPTECPPPIGNTPLTPECIANCGQLTPPGCDCFGCCTLCDATGCYDVITNPTTSPNCDSTTIGDPTKCMRCTQVDSCGTTNCGGDTCILCPGQDPNTLPTSCNGTSTCPAGEADCSTDPCPDQVNTYCSAGCCIGVIQ